MEKLKSAKVLACAFNRETGEPVANPREEVLDLKDGLWKDVSTVADIAKRYMSFWNDLNPDTDEIILVQSVRINQDY
jgi:hypothetical protein